MSFGREPMASDPVAIGLKDFSRYRRVRAAASVALLVASLIYIAYALRGQWSMLAQATLAIPPRRYPLLLALATITLLPAIAYHPLALRRVGERAVPWPRLAQAYALGQIARYLPGKVFGLALQANLLHGQVPLARIAVAVLVQMAMAYAWAATFAGAIVCAHLTGTGAPLTLIPAAAVGLWLAHRHALAERCAHWIARVVRRRPIHADGAIEPLHSFAATALLVIQWLPFIALWHTLLGNDDWASAAVLASCYLLASMFGSALILLPSGIVVREAAFVSLGIACGYAAATLLPAALLMRLLLTVADLACAGLTSLLRYRERATG